MGWLALLLVGLAGWLIWTGRLQRMAKGKPVIGAPVLIGAGLFLLRRYKPRPRATPAPPQHRIDDLAQARALLGIGPDADPAAIRAAHRRLIASVHPDKGGTEALAAQINAARDLLLADRQEG
jgi:hypothetical protein